MSHYTTIGLQLLLKIHKTLQGLVKFSLQQKNVNSSQVSWPALPVHSHGDAVTVYLCSIVSHMAEMEMYVGLPPVTVVA